MKKDYLAHIRSISAVRIFLNIMGFRLDDVSDINIFSKIKIRNKDMKVVGKLLVNDDQLIVKIKDNSLSLKARCNISGNTAFWNHKINFEIKQKNKINFSGEFSFSAVCDSRYDKNCICMPKIICTAPGIDNIEIKLFHDGKFFGLNLKSLYYNETIEITNGHDNFIRHVITNEPHDDKNNEHYYKLYSGVFNSPEFDKNSGKLHLFFSESLDGKIIKLKEDYVDKTISNGTSELLIQKGLLMNQLDNSMIDRIKQVRNLLVISDNYLLDNLFGVCYDDYSDLELQSLSGISKNNLVYQDGAHSLSEAYLDDKKSIVKKRKLTG